MGRKDKIFFALLTVAIVVTGMLAPGVASIPPLSDRIEDEITSDAVLMDQIESDAESCVEWSGLFCSRETCSKGRCVIWTADYREGLLPNGRTATFEVGFHQLRLMVWREVDPQ